MYKARNNNFRIYMGVYAGQFKMSRQIFSKFCQKYQKHISRLCKVIKKSRFSLEFLQRSILFHGSTLNIGVLLQSFSESKILLPTSRLCVHPCVRPCVRCVSEDQLQFLQGNHKMSLIKVVQYVLGVTKCPLALPILECTRAAGTFQ